MKKAGTRLLTSASNNFLFPVPHFLKILLLPTWIIAMYEMIPILLTAPLRDA